MLAFRQVELFALRVHARYIKSQPKTSVNSFSGITVSLEHNFRPGIARSTRHAQTLISLLEPSYAFRIRRDINLHQRLLARLSGHHIPQTHQFHPRRAQAPRVIVGNGILCQLERTVEHVGEISLQTLWFSIDKVVVITKFAISRADLLFLNPGIDANCTTGLWKNYNYCVAPVCKISNYPGYNYGKPRYTPTASLTDLTPESGTVSPTHSGLLSLPTQLPLAPGSRTDCKQYYEVTRPGKDCAALVYGNGITFDDFVQWNPCKFSRCNQ